MLRSEIISSVGTVIRVARLIFKGAHAYLEATRGRSREAGNNAQTDVWKAWGDISAEVPKLTFPEMLMIEILGLKQGLSVDTWSTFNGGTESSPAGRQIVQNLYISASSAHEFLPRFATLLERASDKAAASETAQGVLPNLRVVMIEGSDDRSSPDRVIEAMNAINDLYFGFATLEHEATNTLAFVACDSGSNKLFDFAGSGEVMGHIRGFLTDVWKAVMFRKTLQKQAELEVVVQSLEVIARVKQLEVDGTLDKGVAFEIQRRLIGGAVKFIEAGLALPEFEAAVAPKPEALLKPSTKLLIEGPKLEGPKPSRKPTVKKKQPKEKERRPDSDDGQEEDEDQ